MVFKWDVRFVKLVRFVKMIVIFCILILCVVVMFFLIRCDINCWGIYLVNVFRVLIDLLNV